MSSMKRLNNSGSPIETGPFLIAVSPSFQNFSITESSSPTSVVQVNIQVEMFLGEANEPSFRSPPQPGATRLSNRR